MNYQYNHSPYYYKRIPTRVVPVGETLIGGSNPIRIQSMTNTDTQDVDQTVNQILELEHAGCEIVRITVPSRKDAESLPSIRQKLKLHKSKVPIVADIHFTPTIAMDVVPYVEKIRINPGNFADKKKFQVLEYTDQEYNLEIERISEIFSPLVLRCKELGVAMRIGTNHGSLSDRIMNRFGDTPQGMVESALEFIHIARSLSYHNIIVSMKASNTQIMIQAYRLLMCRFLELKFDYPIHLGVTEAGDGLDGRIKSAIGIGSLLADGIGDTIRVSLTENPVKEIPVAKEIIEKFIKYSQPLNNSNYKLPTTFFKNPFKYSKKISRPIQIDDFKIGGSNLIQVETKLDLKVNPTDSKKKEEFNYIEIEEIKDFSLKNFSINVILPDPINKQKLLFEEYPRITINPFLFSNLTEIIKVRNNKNYITELKIPSDKIDELPTLLKTLDSNSNIIFSLNSNFLIYDYRRLAFHLTNYTFPIVLTSKFEKFSEAIIELSINFGSLLIDGIGDLIRLTSTSISSQDSNQLLFDILQGSRLRITKTEYISCPSCGRTLFDLEETTARIKLKTSHLKEIKIAIMGCVVNGPGEMADADFGYVGAGPGKVHLYKGKEIVLKSVPSDIADEKLVELIKLNNLWKEPD